jgi:hypothetical protein
LQDSPTGSDGITTCVTCGEELHPERAEKYDYCTKPECLKANARGLRVVAVGVNKAADQFVVLDEKTAREAASGRYKKEPDTGGSVANRSRGRGVVGRGSVPEVVPRSRGRSPRRSWSPAQENLALTYREMGLAPDAIAAKLGISRRLVTQILLGAPRRTHSSGS